MERKIEYEMLLTCVLSEHSPLILAKSYLLCVGLATTSAGSSMKAAQESIYVRAPTAWLQGGFWT
jgi:hypothetical protein